MIFTEYIRISYNCFIVGIRRRTVGNKARFAVCVGSELADFMGHGFAVVGGILRGIGDDVALFESGGVNLFNQYQVACAEIGLAHGVGQDDKRLVAEQIAVGTVKGGYRNNGEYHHKNGESHHHPHKYTSDYF